jgi:hypothetical protein
MLTTLIIEDRLFKAAKKKAAEDGTTLSEVVNSALREEFRAKPQPEPPPFPLQPDGLR